MVSVSACDYPIENERGREREREQVTGDTQAVRSERQQLVSLGMQGTGKLQRSVDKYRERPQMTGNEQCVELS